MVYGDLSDGGFGFHSIFDYKRALAPHGGHVMTGGSMKQIFQAMLGPLLTLGGSKKMHMLSAKARQKDLNEVRELIEAGRVKPVIDRRYPLKDTAIAFRYYEEGRTRGKIIIQLK